MHALPKLQQCARAFYQLNYDEERHLPPAPREQNEKGIEKEREREMERRGEKRVRASESGSAEIRYTDKQQISIVCNLAKLLSHTPCFPFPSSLPHPFFVFPSPLLL